MHRALSVAEGARGVHDAHGIDLERPLDSLVVKSCLKITLLGLRSMFICLFARHKSDQKLSWVQRENLRWQYHMEQTTFELLCESHLGFLSVWAPLCHRELHPSSFWSYLETSCPCSHPCLLPWYLLSLSSLLHSQRAIPGDHFRKETPSAETFKALMRF